jgi:carbon monoxide dehydrogenase subunit G
MELTHSFTVPTSVDDAWALFMDLERVGGCFPGATVTEVTDERFSGTVKVKLGPIALVYAGSGAFVERDDAAHHAVIAAKGKDKRGNGTAGATVSIQLAADGEGTRADVSTDLAVTGKPAQFGRGVMQDVSDKLLQAFVACIEKQLTGPSVEEKAAPAPEAPVPDEPVTQPAASAQPPPPRRVRSDVEEDAALDLGSAVMPVLIQRYAGYAVAALVGVVIGWLLSRGNRRD